EFRPLGFVFEISAHEYLKRWRSAEVYAGVDIGAFITDSDVPGIFENISQRGIFVTPSLKLRYRTAEKAYVDLMAGAGWYEIDFTELFCTPQCIELNEAHSANGFGGYIGIGTGIGRSLNAGLKLHFTEFGNATGLGSGAGSLGGPIVMFTVGWRILG
ncbi:MAG: hypothetical protein HKP32_05420, partial [Woeseia sp.]|nr:hypothetical protein [Woeseia sp.]